MPRPSDHYTHSQFEPVESDFQGETVRCMHCRNWSGSVKTLSRKKEHLLKCSAYAAWRAAGNGQDLPPPNKYNKRDSAAMNDDVDSPTYNEPFWVQQTPSMTRNKLPDLSRFFDEFWDDSTAQKCMRTRCQYCGTVRAKNSTRQVEHLQQCNEFLQSSDGAQAQADGLLDLSPAEAPNLNRPEIFRGTAPNNNFQLHRQRSRGRGGFQQQSQRPNQTPTQPKPSPSLVNHLLAKNSDGLSKATQQQFLSHAGCGTLSPPALQDWLAQQNHMSRALVTFIGNVIGKIRLADAKNPLQDTNWRTLDLLVSCINNAKRELEFLRNTGHKYGLQGDSEGPKPASKGLIDLFAASSGSNASLLEAMVVLWSIQHLHCVSWQYAATFLQAAPPNPTSYSLPSYLQPGPYDSGNPFSQEPLTNGASENSANAALREALIPNWTSSGFAKFVDACKAIVDELANSQTSGNGALELGNCELVFKQVLWLWKQMWPEVTGMGEQNETADDDDGAGGAAGNAQGERNGTNGPIEIPDDEEDDVERDDDAPAADSPFGALGEPAITNRASNRV